MMKSIKSLFSRAPQKKSFSPYMSFVNFLVMNGWSNLSAFQSLQYYLQVSPLFDAIDKISRECCSIKLFVQNKTTEKYEKNHQIIDLFDKPNTDVGRSEFMDQLVSYFLITGNVYIVATGEPNKPALELYVISPEYITLTPDEHDGYTRTIVYNSSERNIYFNREIVDGRHRFYSADHRQEIWHIRKFNPLRGFTNNYGLSPLTPNYYEIEQYIKSGIHNLSLLTRGCRPTGALKTGETLTDENFARLQEQFTRFNAGPENTGNFMILEQGLEFQEMGLSNKDMDFERLKDSIVTKLYNVYNIPLALISKESMSYNNLETARLSLYDFAVLPVFNRLLEEMSNFLMHRYDAKDLSLLTYNKDSISALQLRRSEELLLTKNLAVNSLNEIRAMKGDKPATGGDNIYSSGAAYPIARIGEDDGFYLDETQTEDEKQVRLEFVNAMRKTKRADGQPAFTKNQIKALIHDNKL